MSKRMLSRSDLSQSGVILRAVGVILFAAMCVVPRVGSQESATKLDSIQQAQELMDQANALLKDGKYAAAIPLAERAIAIREKVLGPEHPDTATSLNTLGQLYRLNGDYTRAEPLYRQALEIRDKVLGPEHPDTATALAGLGILHLNAGAYAKAEPLLRRALGIREKIMGPEHPDTASSLNSLANLYVATGAYAPAEPLYQRVLAIREKILGPEHPYTADSLGNLALLFVAKGAYPQAVPLYRRALAIREKVQGPEHPQTANALNNLARLYLESGAYTKAEPLYRRALAINEKVLGSEHPIIADSLESLAYLYSITGAYAQAEPLLRRALAINEKALGPENLDTARSLNNLAELYVDTGDYATAVQLLQRAHAIKEKALGPEHPHIALSFNNLALVHKSIGAYAQAEPLFLRALAIEEKVLGPEHPKMADSLRNLAALYTDIGDYAQAEPLYRRVLAVQEKTLGPEHPDTAATLNALAALKWAEDEPIKALPLLQRAQAVQAKNSEQFLLSGSEVRKQAYLQARAKDTYKNVSFSVSVPGSDSVALGLTSVLQFKGRVLDAMSDSVARVRQSIRANDRALFEQLAQVANHFSTLTYQGPGNLSPEAYRQRLNELGRQQASLEADLSKRSGEFRRQVAPITLAAISRAIPQNAVLVEWFRYIEFDPKATGLTAPTKPRYAAYVLKRDAHPVVIDIGDAPAIEVVVREFRLAVSDSKRTDVKVNAAALSEKLLKPLRVHLKGFDHLLISPDGALNLVPMAALLNEQGEYMAQRFEITYLTSGRDLLRMDSKSSTQGNAVVMADPEFGSSTRLLAQADPGVQAQRSVDMDRGGLLFRPLANTALEAQALKSLLKLDSSSVLMQINATEASLKQLHGPRILHVASHGFFLNDQELTAELKKRTTLGQSVPASENPLLRSGIALAGANARRSGANDDGILTALEAAQLDLHGTELVVLSACDSGVGDVQNGEGVYGLRRALVLAGAQTQITSLWKVSDEATRMLMVDYYQRLLKGEGRSAALRHAQQTMLANPDQSHPYYWASFVPIGNWTPLPALH